MAKRTIWYDRFAEMYKVLRYRRVSHTDCRYAVMLAYDILNSSRSFRSATMAAQVEAKVYELFRAMDKNYDK